MEDNDIARAIHELNKDASNLNRLIGDDHTLKKADINTSIYAQQQTRVQQPIQSQQPTHNQAAVPQPLPVSRQPTEQQVIDNSYIENTHRIVCIKLDELNKKLDDMSNIVHSISKQFIKKISNSKEINFKIKLNNEPEIKDKEQE
jgi:hypothetical protein